MTPTATKNLILVTVSCQRTPALIDSGATVSCISQKFAEKLGINYQCQSNIEDLIGADGRRLQVITCVELVVGIRGVLVPHDFYIIRGLNHNALIGLDFMQVTRCKLDLASATASFLEDLEIRIRN